MTQSSLWLRAVCLKNSISISDQQLALLEEYVRLLVGWNAKINLISRKDVENVWANHILHSISLLFKLQLKDGAKLLDLGTGGGLPGIPLKVMNPSVQLTLVDSTQKKIGAVQDMIRKLKLKDSEAVWGRAEEIGKRKQFARTFDYVIARAVGPLPELVRYSMSLLSGAELTSLGGKQSSNSRPFLNPPALIVFKGGEVEEEIRRASTLKGVRSTEIVQLVFAGSEEISLTDKKLVIVKF